MTTAFVLSGGGSLGAIQVGMLQALAARGIEPDVLVGTSAGALNSAYIAGHGVGPASLDALETLWTKLRRRDVFPLQPLRVGAAAFGRTSSLCDDGHLRALIRRNLRFQLLEDFPTPVKVIATDVRTGQEVVLDQGNAVDAVMASAAIPAVFPAVHIDGQDLIDGGIADNAAISQAIESGADLVYVLPTGYACALDMPPASPLSSAVQALTLLIEQRLIFEVRHLADQADIRVVPPLCPLSVSSADFRHGAELVRRALASTNGWLDGAVPGPEHRERVLSLHGHQAASKPTHTTRH